MAEKSPVMKENQSVAVDKLPAMEDKSTTVVEIQIDRKNGKSHPPILDKFLGK